MSTTRVQKETRAKPKTTSTISWVSDKLAAGAARVNGGEFQVPGHFRFPLDTVPAGRRCRSRQGDQPRRRLAQGEARAKCVSSRLRKLRDVCSCVCACVSVALREIVASTPNSKKVIYIVHALYERLVAPNETWLVVLKTLMVYHKLLKADGEATFKSQVPSPPTSSGM